MNGILKHNAHFQDKKASKTALLAPRKPHDRGPLFLGLCSQMPRNLLPTQAYVEKSMQAADVQDFIVRNRFKKPVYMIMSVKVTTGPKVSSMHTTGFDMWRQQVTMICS